MKLGNANIKVRDYVSLNVQDGKAKYDLSGHTEGSFLVLVLDLTTRTFVIQHDDVVERVSIYRVGWVPSPIVTEALPENSGKQK